MSKIKLEIISNGMNGEGIARYDGKVVFVDGAVEDDVVYARIVKSNKNFSIAKICEFEVASAYRRQAKCKYFKICGGCDLQHINYEKQLLIKTRNVQNLFDKQKLNVFVNSCVSSNMEFGYRNKLTMYLSKNNCLSFYQKGTDVLVDVDSCLLVDKLFNRIIQNLNQFFAQNPEFNYNVVKGVSIRQVNSIFVINFILTKKLVFTKLENYLKLHKIKASVYYCINTENNLPTSPCIYAFGEKYIYIEERDIRYPIYPLAFLQVNNYIKDKIYGDMLNFVKSGNVILDAYSGSGLLSSMFSKKCKKVYAVEINESASNACKEICRLNGITSSKLLPICGDCAVEVPKILNEKKIDYVILDPARKGVDSNTLNAIVNAKPKGILYLSCNPATLTRDLRFICDNGYNIKLVQPYDMFPNTCDVEVLVSLVKNDM